MTAPTNVEFSSGTTITSNWLNGVNDYVNELNPADHSASNVTYTPAGTGAVTTNVQAKLRETVSVKDFGAVGDGVTDDTAAWQSAQAASDDIRVPPGTYLLDNFRFLSGKTIQGAGRNNTFVKQKTSGNYAVNALSNGDTVSGQIVGQLIGISLIGVGFIGHASASVAVLNVEANGVFAIFDSVFDYTVRDSFQALRINCPDANAVFNCNFKVQSNNTSSIAAVTGGVYNIYDLFLTTCNSGVALTSTTDFNANFLRVTSDGSQQYSGQMNLVSNATIEAWPGTVGTIGIDSNGFNNRFINPVINSVPDAKCPVAFRFANTTTVLGARVIGSYPGTCPQYSATLVAGSKGTISDFVSAAPIKIDVLTPQSTIQNWSFIGDCSDLTDSQRESGQLNYLRVSPAASAGSTTFTDNLDALLLQPATDPIATYTVVMPPNPLDKAVVRISATNGAITALTVSANAGQNILGAPTTLSSNASFAMIWQSGLGFWFPIS